MDITGIIQEQRAFFLEGNTQSIAFRKENLIKLKQALKKNELSITDAVYKDFKKSYFEVMENELGLVYAEIRYTLKKLVKWSVPKKPITSLVNLPGQSRVYPIPFGNVLIISPWNYPVQLALIPVISAIAAGNTILLKPSELTSHTSGVLAQIINQAFPHSYLYVQEGGAEETGIILKHRFDKIFFTGSTVVGKIVMKAAAENLTPLTLELGGKNPVLVLPDCNLKMTAKRIVWGKFHNGGQACVSPDHVFVHESIKDSLLAEIKLNVEKMYRGKPFESEAFPRIIDDKHYKRLIGLIDNKKCYLGGSGDAKGRFIEPTVLSDLKHDDPIMQEEVFGPILPVLSYTDLDQLLEKLKQEPSPLALYIFSNNIKKAGKIQKEFRSGGGMINDTVVHFVNNTTPFGGIGDSGMGNYHGRAGFDCFSHQKTVIKKPMWFELWVKYPPYTKSKLKIVKFLLR